MPGMRLDKWLSQNSHGSRTMAQALCRSGIVTVDGTIEKNPATHINPEINAVAVSGQPVGGPRHLYIMLNKPEGVITAASDSRAPTVMDGLPREYLTRGCMPVGRLDKDTTGLLLLTTDGELGHYLLSPKRHVEKEYRAVVTGQLTAQDVAAFNEGIQLKDFTAKPAGLVILSNDPETSTALVTLSEGKYHQVKRMFAARGKEVTTLHRTAFGSLRLDTALAPGKFRPLREEEISALYHDVGKPAPEGRHKELL